MRRKNSLTSVEFMTFKATRRINGRFFTLLIGPAFADRLKYACVVSKKVARKAVSRNLIKRRCREAIRGEHTEGAKPRSLVFYAKSSATEASFADVREDVKSLLSSAKS